MPTSRPTSVDRQVPQQRTEDEAASLEKAIAALEAQRTALGDAVVDTAVAPLRPRLSELSAPLSEQRRLVTVVFADLVDFTGLSRRLDAEDTREVVNAYFERWQAAIEEHGGVVEKFIGDAVMAVFGLRRSFEDDAQRAVRAALQIIDGLDDLNDALKPRYGVRLHLRVGVDTGEVVVSTLGERAGHEFVAVGPTVNRAARLQAAAPVDMVLVSAETRRQIRGIFGMDAQGALSLKGIDEPVEAWVVHTERQAGFRIERAGGVEGVETLTVGRDPQLRHLQERLGDVAEESRWRVLTILGEAGIGKSRLLFDFDAWLAERPDAVWWFRGRASPTTQNTVNALLRDLLAARLGIQVSDTGEQVRQRFVDGFTAARGVVGEREGLLVAAWLGYDVPPRDDLPTDPQALRDRGTEALGHYFRTLSHTAPVVVLLEDLHWADEGTLRWLDAVDPLLADARVLVVGTARPALLESRPRWGEGLAHHERVDLPELSMRQSRELVGQILQRVERVPDVLQQMVIEAAEGNPFYIEELVTWLVDAGVVVKAEPHWIVVEELVGRVAVPSTLKGVLQSRLDALSAAERALLQRAAVVGRVFWDTALGATPSLTDDLDGLRHRQIVLQREMSRFAAAREFLFKHALLRDVAYDGILRAQRERYHLATGQWLVEVSEASGRDEEYAAIIAEHLERGRAPEAASWYLRAGRRAASVFALQEAGSLLERALALAVVPDLTFDVLEAREALMERLGDRDGQAEQIAAMIALPSLNPERAVRLLTIRANSAFVHSDYDQARRLTGQAVQDAHAIGRTDLRAGALLLQGKTLTWADDTEAAEACLQQAVLAGRSAELPSVVGEALRYLGMLAGNTGDYEPSLDYLNQAYAVFARTGDTEMESAALAQKATTLFHMTRFDEAQEALEGTLPIFRRAGHRYREAIALGNLASIAVVRGRYADADRWARDAIAICRDMDELEAIAVNLLVLAQGELFTGRFESTRTHAEEALEIARSVGNAALEADALARLVALAVVRGEFDSAIALGVETVAAGEHASSDLDRGHSHLALGHALRWSSRDDEAMAQFEEARSLFAGLSLDALVREATVAQAWVLASQGSVESVAEAVAVVDPVLPFLTREGLIGTGLPATMLRGCLDVLRLAEDPRAAAVLADARAYLHATAAEIGDPDLEAGYLSIPPNAWLLRAHQHADVIHGSPEADI